MKDRVIYLFVCAVLLAMIAAAENAELNSKTSSDVEYQPAVHTISANTFTYYAIEQDHTLYAWGERYPQSPVLEDATPILENALSVAAGWRGCLAIDTQRRLWSIGEYLVDRPGPEPQLVMENIADVSVGLNHFICLTTEGDVYVCGRNSTYQLTEAVEVDKTSQYSPPVCVMSGAKAIAASDDGCCVLTDNGNHFFWGTFIEFTSPEPVLVGRGFDDLPYGTWAVKGNDLYAIEETKTLTGLKLTTEKILEGVREVYAGIIRTTDGRFLAAGTESNTFQEISLPEDITYACSSDLLLVQRSNGTIEQDEKYLDCNISASFPSDNEECLAWVEWTQYNEALYQNLNLDGIGDSDDAVYICNYQFGNYGDTVVILYVHLGTGETLSTVFPVYGYYTFQTAPIFSQNQDAIVLEIAIPGSTYGACNVFVLRVTPAHIDSYQVFRDPSMSVFLESKDGVIMTHEKVPIGILDAVVEKIPGELIEGTSIVDIDGHALKGISLHITDAETPQITIYWDTEHYCWTTLQCDNLDPGQ